VFARGSALGCPWECTGCAWLCGGGAASELVGLVALDSYECAGLVGPAGCLGDLLIRVALGVEFRCACVFGGLCGGAGPASPCGSGCCPCPGVERGRGGCEGFQRGPECLFYGGGRDAAADLGGDRGGVGAAEVGAGPADGLAGGTRR
jgi:hypothetical protein